MYNIIQKAIDYASQNKMRLLIEVEPNNERVFVYCDEFNVSDLSQILKLDVPIAWKTTNQFIRFDYYPKCIKLEMSKGKFQKPFWRQCEIDLIEQKDKDVYFVEIMGEFTQDEKDVLFNIVKPINISSHSLEELHDMIKIDYDDVQLNLFNKFGIIFFK